MSSFNINITPGGHDGRPGRGGSPLSPLLAIPVACLTALVCALALACAPAGAAVTHAFDAVATEALGKGVPVGCAGAKEPPCVKGALSGVASLSAEAGRLWVGDGVESYGKGRIDGFETGAPFGFSAPQIDEEAGVSQLALTSRATGLAVGHVPSSSENQVYTLAYREGQQVVAMYGATSGKLLGTWTGANTLNKSFTMSGGKPVAVLSGVAVDRSANPLTTGDVYVATGGGSTTNYHVVDVFKGEPAGTVGEEPALVATLTGTCPNTGESCPGKVIPFEDPREITVSGVNGDVFVSDERVVDVFEPGPLNEYVFVRQLTGTPSGLFRELGGIAVDGGSGSGAGDLYVAERAGVVDEFSDSGVFVGRLTGVSASSPFGEVESVAVDPGTHDVFVADHTPGVGGGAVDVFGPNVVLPDVESAPVSAITVSSQGAIEATFNGSVDPLGEGEAKCQFVWGTSEAFGSPLADCEPEGATTQRSVSSTVRGLSPDTSYVYRLQASNHNGFNPGEAWQDRRFTTPGPGIHSESVTSLSSTAVTLNAGIDPNNASTRFYFQYSSTVPTSDCEAQPEACSTAPGAPGELLPPGGGTDVNVGIHVQDLSPGTVYHYRVVAVSDLEVGSKTVVPVTFAGADRTFMTQPAGSAFALPDARQWELVTPPNKHGAVVALGLAESLVASVSGDAMSYTVSEPTEQDVQGYTDSVQVFSHRAAGGGWSSQDIATPHASATGSGVGYGFEYRAFSEDLSSALVEPLGPFTSLAPDVFPTDTERTPYLRHDTTCSTEPGTCYEPLATGAEGYADVQSGTKFGGVESGIHPDIAGAVHFVGASPDLKHVILTSQVQLTETAIPAGVRELYEWSADKPAQERLQLVSRTEETGQPSPTTAFLGFEGNGSSAVGRGAVSRDGSRVFWTEENGGLSVWDASTGVSLRLDLAHGGNGIGRVRPVFQGASADGRRVFFLDEQRLTADSGAQVGKPDLYVCDIAEDAGTLKCVLHDLTPLNGAESASVQGSAPGISANGSWVYFVTNGVIAGTETEGAQPGDCQGAQPPVGATCNLYVAHEGGSGWGAPRLVAVLSADDYPDWSANEPNLARLTARVSDDGLLVFMSDRSLTGYDNRDAVSEKLDEEVFLYTPAGEAMGKLACASCDPTSARPVGVEFAKIKEGLVGGFGGGVWGAGQWLAASVPGYNQYESTRALYQPRYLSNEGRVFFDSADALVPQDVNHNQDVYEFEPAGVGGPSGCNPGSSTYSSVTDGCIALVSSGKAAGESAFIDASETGSDVFFLTGEKLTGNDVDNAFDVYDAHACTATAPCTTETPVPPACTTADACRTAPEPQPAIFGSPASATFTGSGNVTPASPAPALKAKALTRAQKLARALSACRKHRNRHKRGACERKAHKQFGASQVRSGKAIKRGKG